MIAFLTASQSEFLSDRVEEHVKEGRQTRLITTSAGNGGQIRRARESDEREGEPSLSSLKKKNRSRSRGLRKKASVDPEIERQLASGEWDVG